MGRRRYTDEDAFEDRVYDTFADPKLGAGLLHERVGGEVGIKHALAKQYIRKVVKSGKTEYQWVGPDHRAKTAPPVRRAGSARAKKAATAARRDSSGRFVKKAKAR